MKTERELREMLSQIDRKSYPAYKGLKGNWSFPDYVLSVDHVQGDPFAAPSRLSIRVSGEKGGFPAELYRLPCQRIALQDELTRRFAVAAGRASHQAKGSGHSGMISVSRCGQEILERSACTINPVSGELLFRLEMGFPANGRTINGREMEKLLFVILPGCVSGALFYRNLDRNRLKKAADLAEDQQFIRDRLPEMGLAAFIADGSILPRESGVSAMPMKKAVPFCSPESLSVTMDLPHRGRITGMGIPKGITLIVGGGYHGKSTLLKALEMGVYNHVAGDGREYVISDATSAKVRAEDGRSIQKTDIAMFINHLPNGKDTTSFTTEDASGSTSQAANVVESMEAGAKVLLMDEDTSATNFLIRDALMQKVIHRDKEPITPFMDRIRMLYQRYGVSTILVAGSSGAYFHKADLVIQMDRYVPKEITAAAKEAALAFPEESTEPEQAEAPLFRRYPEPSPAFHKADRIKLKVLGRDGFVLNRETVDLRYLEQLADGEQSAALGYCMIYAQKFLMDGKRTVRDVVDSLERLLDQKGLDGLFPNEAGLPFLARPRTQELFACIDRYRGLKVR